MHLRTLVPVLLAFLGACAAPQLELAATYGQLASSGHAKIAAGGGAATASSSLSDLGLDDTESSLELRGDFKWGLPHLTVATQSASWSGSGTVDVDFGDVTAGSDVDSELDLALHRAILTFDLLPTDTLELGLGLGVAVVDFKGTVEDTGGLASEKVDEVLPIPVLAARLAARVWVLDCEALVSGLTATVDGNDLSYLQTDLDLKYAFFGDPGEVNGSIILGWRQIDLAAKYEDGGDLVDLDLGFSGPYLGVQIGL